MKKWLRWQGVVVFLVLGAVIAIVWLFLVDRMVKAGIEKAGTRAVGARVELASADFSLFPLGLDLEKLQVTNPDAPMTNIVDVGHISLLLEAEHLLRKKIIVREMGLENVQFNTPRKVSGAIKEGAPTPPESDSTSKFSLDLPNLGAADVKDILKKEKLETLEAAEKFKTDVLQEQKNFEAMLKELPDEKTFQQYRQRVEKLQKGGGSIGDFIGAASATAPTLLMI